VSESVNDRVDRVLDSGPDQDEPEAPAEELGDSEEATPADISAAIMAGWDVEVADSTAIARQIAGRIFQAETPEALWEPIVPVGARDLTERPIRVFEFQALRSGQGNRKGVYVVIDAVDLVNGEKLLVTCGATNVVAKLLRAAEIEALPENLKFVLQPSRSNPDRMVIDLRLVPKEQLP